MANLKKLLIGRVYFILILTVFSVSLSARAFEESPATYMREHYTKLERMIPMRDGVRLFTSIYVPKDTSRSYPFLMNRTPYSSRPYGLERFRSTVAPLKFLKEGFIFVVQDVRGAYMSEGEFVNMRPHIAEKTAGDVDESTDCYDTVEWLLENIPNHNGRVGIWGISYPGFYTSASIIDTHPAIKAASPQAPIADWFWDDMHHHGAFTLTMSFNFFAAFGRPRPEPTTSRGQRFRFGTPDGYQFFLELGPLKNVQERHFHGEIPFWNQTAAHPNYDEFWQARNILPHLKQISCAVMVVGGLFDAEDLYGAWQTYRSIEKQNPDIENNLVMGPWRHGGWMRTDGSFLGDWHFGSGTSEWYRTEVFFPFFKHFLKDGPDPDLPEALVFETGANQWREFDTWPPREVTETSLYMHKQGGLSFEQPSGPGEAWDEFVSDPRKPVPYTKVITTGWEATYMAEDQRFAASRPDVLVYRSEILDEDVTLVGPLEADLWVSTSGSSADWVVKLIDVLPNDTRSKEFGGRRHILGGAQLMVRSEIFRGRFRESYKHPKPFTPGEITRVRFQLQDVLHTFRAGHRIMIQIQSSFFPLFDRNPQKYVDNIFEADEEDFIKAMHRVYRSGDHPSRIRVTVLRAQPQEDRTAPVAGLFGRSSR